MNSTGPGPLECVILPVRLHDADFDRVVTYLGENGEGFCRIPSFDGRDFTGRFRIGPLDETANCPANTCMNSGCGAGADDEVGGECAHR